MHSLLPLTLSIGTVGGIATPLMLRGTPLPARREQTLSTVSDNQKEVSLTAYVGERKLAAENLKLVTASKEGLPEMKKGAPTN
jgi:molecular chaperone DnaK